MVNTPSPTSLVIFRNAPDSDDDQRGSLPSDYALERLRAEQRFGSVAELAGQIKRDVEAARTVIARADV